MNANERSGVMHHRLTTGSKNKDTLGHTPANKNLKPKKAHPLSAVQRVDKLNNNLYTVVNNKLVRNV